MRERPTVPIRFTAAGPSGTLELMAMVACETCGLVQRLPPLAPGAAAECARCRARLARGDDGGSSLARTAAFSLAALMFYLPANLYPILRLEWYGAHSESTAWDGAIALFRQGQPVIGVVVFLASIAVPFLKLLTLFYLVATVKLRSAAWRRQRTWIFHGLELIGPWAMLDVFVMAVLVALVKLGELATVLPGRGLFSFTAVAVLTMLASTSFDPRLIWERREDPR
jgi:paraquat-inducible protein A